MQGKNTISQKSKSSIQQSRLSPSTSANGSVSQLPKNTTEQKSNVNRKKSQNSFIQGCLGCLGFSILLVIVFIVLLNIFANKGQHSNSNIGSVVSTSHSNINEKISSLITGTIGDKTNTGEKKIIELQVNDHAGTKKEGDKIVVVKLHGNNNLNSQMIKGGMQLESIKIFKQLFQLNEIEEVDLIWQFPTTDTLGNSTLNTVLKINISRTTASKINWDGFDKDNLASVADSYWEHPALRE